MYVNILSKFEADPYEYISSPNVVFAVTVRNGSKYVGECLESILNQRGNNWRCILIDDFSQDDTWEIVLQFLKRTNKIIATRNSKRFWKMRNIYSIVSQCGDEEVVAELDGDDCLLYDTVALDLSRLHCKFDTVWTQHEIDYKYFPDWHTWFSTQLPSNWTRLIPWRQALWTRFMCPGHLRSFKAKYFRAININDFKIDEQWIRSASDAAYYSAIIELTPPSRRYFYARPTVRYRVTPANDYLYCQKSSVPKIEDQIFVSNYIRNLKPYQTVFSPIFFIPSYFGITFSTVFEAISSVRKFIKFAKYCVGIYDQSFLVSDASLDGLIFYNFSRMLKEFDKDFSLLDDVDKCRRLCCLIGVRYILRNAEFEEITILDPFRFGGAIFNNLTSKFEDSSFQEVTNKFEKFIRNSTTLTSIDDEISALL